MKTNTYLLGERVDDFELCDHTGRRRVLSNMVAHEPLVLVFFRGHW